MGKTVFAYQNKIRFLLCVFASCVFNSYSIYASEIYHVHGLHTECDLPQHSQDVVKCAMNNHPGVLRKKNELKHKAAAIDLAKQLPNPELDIEYAQGPQRSSESSLALLQSVEWGGRRDARVQIAKAQNTLLDFELKELQAQVIQKTILHLHRLRQLKQEKQIFLTSIKTLKSLIRQQENLIKLSPEQQVTQSVYRMALIDAKIKNAILYDEEKALEHYFHVATGHSLEELQDVLPQTPSYWPTIPDATPEQLPSPGLLKMQAEEAEFKALLHQAQSETWPRLRLGPMWSSQTDSNGETSSLWGFRLMMDIPLLNQNASARSFAHAGIERNKKDTELLQNVEDHERTEQLKVYRRAVSILKDVPNLNNIEKEFKNNESLAQRGLVSGSLLIEFHRQRAELTQTRHQRELKAIEALWLIHYYDGRIFMESL